MKATDLGLDPFVSSFIKTEISIKEAKDLTGEELYDMYLIRYMNEQNDIVSRNLYNDRAKAKKI